MNLNQNVNIHNRFDIEVKNINTNEVKKYTAYNIILDQMWTRLCGGSKYFVNIHFGTGTGTLAPSRTTLFSYLGTKTAVDEELIKAVPLSTWKRKIVLNPEEYVGAIITEVGIAYGSTASNLVTHAMLKDSEGNIISTQPKTDTEVVTIYATVFVTLNKEYENLTYLGLPNTNSLINYLIGGSSAPTGAFSLCEIRNPSAKLGSTSTVTWTSDTVNKKRKTNVNRFGISTGNGHVQNLEFTNLFNLKLPQDGVFPGQPYSGIPVGIGDGMQKKFILPSMNIRQSSLIIKLNGVIDENISKSEQYKYPVRIASPASLPPRTGNAVALTPDGSVMAVAHEASPFITTYDWLDGAWVKRPDPASWPTYTGYAVALTSDGSVMAVGHEASPFITTYDWLDGAWVKRPDPASLPAYTGYAVALTSDGLVMAVVYSASPFITTYDWLDGAWVKRPDPASLPSSTEYAVALTPDGSVMAVGHGGSPFITTYDWLDGAWVKRPDPASLPPKPGYAVALTPDGSVMAVAHEASPFITTYDWLDGAWVKRPDPALLPAYTGWGVALTSDGSVMAVGHEASPFITTYDWLDGAWVKRLDPASLPPRTGNAVALTPDGSVMAVAHSSSPFITTYMHLPSTTIIFDTPPAVGAVITADYTVDGVHKTDQYVIDVSFAIEFGEGV